MVAAYIAQLGPTASAQTSLASELEPPFAFFLDALMENLRRSGKFEQLFDSRALDSIANHTAGIPQMQAELSALNGNVKAALTHLPQNPAAAPAPAVPYSRLLDAVKATGVALRQYRSKIMDVHMNRPEVGQIVDWVLNAEEDQRLGVLLDQPGAGKTVVMHDVLKDLEGRYVPVLAIKADALSGLKTSDDLLNQLQLPIPLEECARTLADKEGLFVVLVDQVDALSLSLTREQEALNVLLDAVARLRDISNVRIVVSCRVFDLKNDPRLASVDADRTFSLQPLPDHEVKRVLDKLHVDPARLLSSHRQLLTVPLHLDIYSKVVEPREAGGTQEPFRSLQDLYDALWSKYVAALPATLTAGAAAGDRPAAAVYRLVDDMESRKQVASAVGVLDDFPVSAEYLERERLIRRDGATFTFLHQTFFDYAYARRFVANNRSLSGEVLSPSNAQGLFDRSKIIQVLAYLRGAYPTQYLQELSSLLFDTRLRFHLRHMVIGWLGASIENPSDTELDLVRKLLSRGETRVLFLVAAGGNTGWFDKLHARGVLNAMLSGPDDAAAEAGSNYLAGLLQRSDAEAQGYVRTQVLALLRPYLGRSETWDLRIAWCLQNLRDWGAEREGTAEALDMLCTLLRTGHTGGQEEMCFHYLTASNLQGGCQAVRAYLDHWLLGAIQQHEQERGTPGGGLWKYRYSGAQPFSSQLFELVDRASEEFPAVLLENVLPWFVQAVTALSGDAWGEHYYPSDDLFSWDWHYTGTGTIHSADHASLCTWLIRALGRLATSDKEEHRGAFRRHAKKLASVENLAAQRLLAHAYLAAPEQYAYEMADFLLGDKRRRNLGDMGNPSYDSHRLYGEAFRHADAEHRRALEEYVYSLEGPIDRHNRHFHGLEQLPFLLSAPCELLSPRARRLLQELQRRYPDHKMEAPVPSVVAASIVTSPISANAMSKMNDRQWLSAMRRYDDETVGETGRRGPLEGGVIELSRAFLVEVIKDPERFYRMGMRFDDTISPEYKTALITGLAESESPAEWVFSTVRQFVGSLREHSRRYVSWALQKRAEAGVPDDILDMLEHWARYDENPVEDLESDAFGRGINSNRGAALNAFGECALHRDPQETARLFDLLQFAVGDATSAVRAVAIHYLRFLLHQDADRALTLFEAALDGHPDLLGVGASHQFIHYAYPQYAARLLPTIEVMFNNENPKVRGAGATLACLVALTEPGAQELAERALRGDAVQRRGAALVYARNAGDPLVWKACEGGLRQLMDDDDDEVLRTVGSCFMHIHVLDIEQTRDFILAFSKSDTAPFGATHLAQHLWPLALYEHELVLQVTEALLDAADMVSNIVGGAGPQSRLPWAGYREDISRLPLAVYRNATDENIRKAAMDLFERLLKAGNYAAHEALADWDRS